MGEAKAMPMKSAKARRALRKSPFFTLLGLAMLALAIAGFWPQYFRAAVGGAPDPGTQFWLIHLHAALFTLWLVLYLSQAALILTGRARAHVRIGPWLAGYGFAVAAVGMFAAAALAARFGKRENDPEAGAAFVFFPVLDMVYFAGFLTAAVLWRKRPALHKRAMFLATYSIAVVGIGRLIARTGLESPLEWQPLTLAPLLIALGYDLAVCRRVYGIMMAGLAVHLARLNAEGFVETEAWLRIGRVLVEPFR